MKVINVYRGFTEYGGAESILLSVHAGLKERNYECYVAGPNKFSENHPKYNIKDQEYIQLSLKNIWLLKDSVVLSHHRKMTSFLYLAKLILGIKFRLIHVSQNEFHNLRYFTLLPNEVIAVSERVKENLIPYFKVNPKFIKVIYNAVADENNNSAKRNMSEKKNGVTTINILYPARITKVKRQLEVFDQLNGKLSSHIQIHFAGTGEDFDLLHSKTKGSINFKSLGFVSIKDTMPDYDYVMLFSSNEGLPLTLVEGCMFGKPIICNDIAGNMEILQDGYNGKAANSYEELVRVINNLPLPATDAYRQLSLNARKVYEQKFQRQQMVEKYIEVINNPF